MLDKIFDQGFASRSHAIIAATVTSIVATHAPATIAASSTGKSLTYCKLAINSSLESKPRIKLERVTGAKLRLKIRRPGEPSHRVWCEFRDGEAQLSNLDGSPFTADQTNDEDQSSQTTSSRDS